MSTHIGGVDRQASFPRYSLYGLSISSEIPLDLAPTESFADPVDLTFFLAPDEAFKEARAMLDVASSELRWGQRVEVKDGSQYISWPGLCEAWISPEGREIGCYLAEGSIAQSFQTYLFGNALSFSLIKQGLEPLHSTAVVVHGRAIALLGDCGQGKSTLAAAFVEQGHQILTDDLLVIHDHDRALVGMSGFSRLKVFPAIGQRFLNQHASVARMNPFTKKLVVQLVDGQSWKGPAPLIGFFVLNEPENEADRDCRIVRLPRTRALVELVRATFNAALDDSNRLAQLYRAAEAWATRLPLFRVTYPRDLSRIEDVRAAILRAAGLQDQSPGRA